MFIRVSFLSFQELDTKETNEISTSAKKSIQRKMKNKNLIIYLTSCGSGNVEPRSNKILIISADKNWRKNFIIHKFRLLFDNKSSYLYENFFKSFYENSYQSFYKSWRINKKTLRTVIVAMSCEYQRCNV